MELDTIYNEDCLEGDAPNGGRKRKPNCDITVMGNKFEGM